VDRRITATAKAFLAGRGLRPVDVAPKLGMSVTSIYNKLNGTRAWTAAEVAALADLFQISVNDLYTGLSGTFAEATGTWAEQEGTWAESGGSVSTRSSLHLVPTPHVSGLAAAA
jgi:hypothetical protein